MSSLTLGDGLTVSGTTAITGLKFTQAITERSGVFLGKLNALNGDREKFLKYPLTSRFWNAAFNFNLALDRYPYSAPGAGFYDLGLSAQAKDLVPGLRDEYGVELFYNLRIVPGCHLTPDIQVLHPGLAPVNTALVLGIRLKVDF